MWKAWWAEEPWQGRLYSIGVLVCIAGVAAGDATHSALIGGVLLILALVLVLPAKFDTIAPSAVVALLAVVLGEFAVGGEGFTYWSHGASRWMAWIDFLPLMVAFGLVYEIPKGLRRRAGWSPQEGTRKLLPTYLGALAAMGTGVYVVMLHFGGGPLARIGIGRVLIGAVGVMTVTMPLCRWIARQSWDPGIANMLRQSWASVKAVSWDVLSSAGQFRASETPAVIGAEGQGGTAVAVDRPRCHDETPYSRDALMLFPEETARVVFADETARVEGDYGR